MPIALDDDRIHMIERQHMDTHGARFRLPVFSMSSRRNEEHQEQCHESSDEGGEQIRFLLIRRQHSSSKKQRRSNNEVVRLRRVWKEFLVYKMKTNVQANRHFSGFERRSSLGDGMLARAIVENERIHPNRISQDFDNDPSSTREVLPFTYHKSERKARWARRMRRVDEPRYPSSRESHHKTAAEHPRWLPAPACC